MRRGFGRLSRQLLNAEAKVIKSSADQSAAIITTTSIKTARAFPSSSTYSLSRFTQFNAPFTTSSFPANQANDSPPQPPPPSNTTGNIREINSIQDFQAVVNTSMQNIPILVQATAKWCGPCKQLEPHLKAAITQLNGKVILAKLDIDNPNVAPLVNDMGITSVPTMFLILKGRIVDVKQGALPPNELNKWLQEAASLAAATDTTTGSTTSPEGGASVKELLKQGWDILENPTADNSTTITQVAPLFATVLNPESMADAEDKAKASAGLAMCALMEGELETAKDLLKNAASAAEGSTAPPPDEITRVEALVSLIELSQSTSTDERSIEDLQQAVTSSTTTKESKPDLEAMYTLALRLFMMGQQHAGVDMALTVVKKDKEWNEQAGKKLLLKFCEALGKDSALGKSARQRLSNAWFI